MSVVVQGFGRSLTAVLLSAAVAWGSPAAGSPEPAQARAAGSVGTLAVQQPGLALSPAEGPAGSPLVAAGSGFEGCFSKHAGTVSLYWEGEPVGSAEAARGADGFTADLTVPADEGPGEREVRAVCDRDDRFVATAYFTVVDSEPSPPAEEAAVTLTPSEGEAGAAEPLASGSGFNCSNVDLLWDDEPLGSSEVSEEGTFEATLRIATDMPAGDHVLLARCTADPGTTAEATFTVTPTAATPTDPDSTDPAPNPPEPPDPTVPLPPDPNVPNPPDPNVPNPPDPPDPPDPNVPDVDPADPDAPDPPDPPDPNVPDVDLNTDAGGTVPVAWVVGPGLVGVGLLAAAGAALLAHRQRGPRWVHEHVRARLRPHTPTTDVEGPPGHSVRLEPRPDPGEQTVREEDP
ncbi:hypothetical protein [Streptomyces antimicrobicus]|uniref:hypothetical protein n=1 Tax=Streptomyces antimicrobicus TaxID=2883108 RepID=UPI0021F6446E|nr:hypothetical protein [Streptomyces antimicrobicus]